MDPSNPDVLNTSALLDRIFESICRPLKVRIEQVLMTSPPVLLCFQLAQLHSFYLGLITRSIGSSAQLTQVRWGWHICLCTQVHSHLLHLRRAYSI